MNVNYSFEDNYLVISNTSLQLQFYTAINIINAITNNI